MTPAMKPSLYDVAKLLVIQWVKEFHPEPGDRTPFLFTTDEMKKAFVFTAGDITVTLEYHDRKSAEAIPVKGYEIFDAILAETESVRVV